MLVDAMRLSDRKVVEVWAKHRPKIGQVFRVDGERYRRLPNGAGVSWGDAPPFHRTGPITMYTEPFKGGGPVDAPHYNEQGFAVFKSMREIRDYEARCRETGRPVEWTR